MKKNFFTFSAVMLILFSCSKIDQRTDDFLNLDEVFLMEGIMYENDSEIPFSGITASYYKNGLIQYKDTYRDGMPTMMEEYYEDGILKSKYSYDAGNLNGLYLENHPNGQLSSIGVKKDGLDNFITVKTRSDGIALESITCSIDEKEENMAMCINELVINSSCLLTETYDSKDLEGCNETEIEKNLLEYLNNFENNFLNFITEIETQETD